MSFFFFSSLQNITEQLTPIRSSYFFIYNLKSDSFARCEVVIIGYFLDRRIKSRQVDDYMPKTAGYTAIYPLDVETVILHPVVRCVGQQFSAEVEIVLPKEQMCTH